MERHRRRTTCWRGRSLHGQQVLVTGVSSGVGVEIARVLASHGVEVVGTARNLGKAAMALTASGCNDAVELVELDLASLSSVRSCADALLASGRSFDAVIANGGVMAVPFQQTGDGFETQFTTNYLGQFLLVNRLARSLRTDARVVMAFSASHRGADVDLDDPTSSARRTIPSGRVPGRGVAEAWSSEIFG